MKSLKEIQTAFDYEVKPERAAVYYKKLTEWEITDELFPAIVDEVLKKCHRFPALAAFWAAKIETDPWGPSR